MLSSTSFVWVLVLWAIVNASVASTDLWIVTVLFRYPASAHVVDELNGMRIFYRKAVYKSNEL